MTAHSQRGVSSPLPSIIMLCRPDGKPPLPCHHQHGSIQRSPQAQSYRVTQARHKLAVVCGGVVRSERYDRGITMGTTLCPTLPIADAEPQQHIRLLSDSSPTHSRARYQRPFSGTTGNICIQVHHSQSPLTPLCRRAPATPTATERRQLRSSVT